MTITDGSKVKIDYTLTMDGEVVDSSEGRSPLAYTQGSGQIIPGLEKALLGLEAGDEKQVVVSPQEGYGEVNPGAFRQIPKTSLPEDLVPKVGMMLAVQGPAGQSRPVKVSEVKDDSIAVDLNHPLAGKTLNFKVKVA